MEAKTARNLGVVVGLALLLAIVGLIMTGPAHAGGKECDSIPASNLITDDSQVPGNTLVVTAGEWCIGAETSGSESTVLKFNIKVLAGGRLGVGASNRVVALDGNISLEDGGYVIVRNTVLGNISAKGSAQIDLPLKAVVGGNIDHKGKSPSGSEPGWVDFKGGNRTTAPNKGAVVSGNVHVKGGALLKATGKATRNRVEGHIKCGEDSKVAGGTDTDWDGDDNVDGVEDIVNDLSSTIGKTYKCAA